VPLQNQSTFPQCSRTAEQVCLGHGQQHRLTRVLHTKATHRTGAQRHYRPRLTTINMGRDVILGEAQTGIRTIGGIADLAGIPGAGAVATLLESALRSLQDVLVQRARMQIRSCQCLD
jgi:hypothetical protein